MNLENSIKKQSKTIPFLRKNHKKPGQSGGFDPI
jgi:hypothetical protein